MFFEFVFVVDLDRAATPPDHIEVEVNHADGVALPDGRCDHVDVDLDGPIAL